jgi:8-oxo-dGTP pyrophosphatase MutT (NUDIX family)
VPSGTVEEGEAPGDAVLREAQEETGLVGLEIRSYLGSRDYDMSRFGAPGVQRWQFYHLEFRGEAPERWRHCELHPSDGSPGPIEFELSWVSFPDSVPQARGALRGFYFPDRNQCLKIGPVDPGLSTALLCTGRALASVL